MPQIRFLRRYQDLKFTYDRDNSSTQLLRQRVYRSRDGTIETPITSLLLARVVETEDAVPPRTYTPRRVIACFENPQNRVGQTELTAFIPYRPGDPNLVNHAREILTFGEVYSGEYRGETDDPDALVNRFVEDVGELIVDVTREVIDGVTEELARQLLDIIIGILIGLL
jgi:DNA-directed RNA polymerase beta subunit